MISSVSSNIVTSETTASIPRLVDEDADVIKQRSEPRAELDSGVRIEASTEPNTSRPPFCRISAIPSVRMSA